MGITAYENASNKIGSSVFALLPICMLQRRYIFNQRQYGFFVRKVDLLSIGIQHKLILRIEIIISLRPHGFNKHCHHSFVDRVQSGVIDTAPEVKLLYIPVCLRFHNFSQSLLNVIHMCRITGICQTAGKENELLFRKRRIVFHDPIQTAKASGVQPASMYDHIMTLQHFGIYIFYIYHFAAQGFCGPPGIELCAAIF